MGGPSHFGLQCPDCLSRIGPKLEAWDLDVPARDVRWAARKPLRRVSKTNSRRVDYNKRFQSADWKHLRALVLERDGFTCRNCEEPATEVHHLTYERFWKEKLEDLVASCRECNLAEREQRIGGMD